MENEKDKDVNQEIISPVDKLIVVYEKESENKGLIFTVFLCIIGVCLIVLSLIIFIDDMNNLDKLSGFGNTGMLKLKLFIEFFKNICLSCLLFAPHFIVKFIINNRIDKISKIKCNTPPHMLKLWTK